MEEAAEYYGMNFEGKEQVVGIRIRGLVERGEWREGLGLMEELEGRLGHGEPRLRTYLPIFQHLVGVGANEEVREDEREAKEG